MANNRQETPTTGECVFSVRIEGGLAHLSISMDTVNDAAVAAKG